MTLEELNQILDNAENEKNKGNCETAEQLCTDVLKHIAAENDTKSIKLLARTYLILGMVSRSNSDYFLALERYTKALEYSESIADEKEIGIALNGMGLVYWHLSDYPHALEYYGKSLEINEKNDNKEWIAASTGNIGLVYMELSDYPRALEYYSRALAIFEQLNHKTGIALNLANIGLVYDNLADFPRALEYLNKALEIHQETGHTVALARDTGNLGNVYKVLSDYPRALEYYGKALVFAEETGSKQEIGRLMGNIGEVYAIIHFEGHDFTKAEEYLLKAIAILEENSGKKSLFYKHRELADIYEKQERWQEFAVHYKKYHELEKEVLSEEAKKSADRFEVQMLMKEKEIERLKNVELARANEELVKLNSEKNEFLGIAAHDLKNPLSAITTSIGILKRYGSRLTAEEVLEKHTDIERTSQRMLAIITNLLDINAIERGAITFKSELFNLAETVSEVVDSNRQRAEEKHIAIFFDLVPEPAEITADRQITSQVIDNLVSNAVKYSPQNKNVWVKIEPSEKSVKISVQDEGPGLSQEDMEKLFGRFQRLSAKPTGGEHSTGLGLSIVKKLVEAMNGKVWCESELGKGAIFFVELPKE